MKVEEIPLSGEFEVWVSGAYDSDAILDFAELVELHSVIQRALFDYLARVVSSK